MPDKDNGLQKLLDFLDVEAAIAAEAEYEEQRQAYLAYQEWRKTCTLEETETLY